MTMIFIVIGLISFNPAQVTYFEQLELACKIHFQYLHSEAFIKDMTCAEVIKEIDRQIGARK